MSTLVGLAMLAAVVLALLWAVRIHNRICPICLRKFDSELEMHQHFERSHHS